MTRAAVALAAVATLVATVSPGGGGAACFAADALDSYRVLPRAARVRVVACARAAIERACQPAGDASAPPDTADSLALDWPGPPCGVYLSLARGRGSTPDRPTDSTARRRRPRSAAGCQRR